MSRKQAGLFDLSNRINYLDGPGMLCCAASAYPDPLDDEGEHEPGGGLVITESTALIYILILVL